MPERRDLRLERLALRALADDQEVRVRDGGEDRRPGLEQGRVALLRLEPGDDADDRRAGRDRGTRSWSVPQMSGSE